MKTTISILLALLLAARLGAADAPITTSLSLAMPQLDTMTATASDGVGYVKFDGGYYNHGLKMLTLSSAVATVISQREPIVTRTADGWSITFAEPATAKSYADIVEDAYRKAAPHRTFTVVEIAGMNPHQIWARAFVIAVAITAVAYVLAYLSFSISLK